jgi:hypothetical protein
VDYITKNPFFFPFTVIKVYKKTFLIFQSAF